MIHSVLSPSAGGKWAIEHGCTAYPTMALLYPQGEDNQDAKEGNAAHEIASKIISELSRGITPSFKKFDGKFASNGIAFDSDMFDAALIYAQDVSKMMHQTHVYGGDNLRVEQKVNITRVHELCYGFVDCSIFSKPAGHLYIWEFKYGHRAVDAFECVQLMLYVCGLIEHYQLIDSDITVHMRVIQPRCYHNDGAIQEWVCNLSDLRGQFNHFEANAHKALSEHAVLRSGPHCRDCCALHECPSAIQGGMSLYETAMQTDAVNLAPDALAVQYSIVDRALKQLTYVHTSLSAQMESMISNGTVVPGYEISYAAGREAWNGTAQEVIALGQSLSIDLAQAPKAITVNQARTKGMQSDVIALFTKRKSGKRKLTPINTDKLKRLFT